MDARYKGYRYPKGIIGYAVRLYYRYKLSLRDISELLLERGIAVTYEAIRHWIQVFGPLYAQALRKTRGPASAKKWHMDEVRVKIKGEVFWLWRLVNEQGEDIEILLQKRRNAKSAIRFLKKALKTAGNLPKYMITDKLKSYVKAHRILLKSRVKHLAHKGLNNRAENSHQPTREKEKQMRGFKKVASTQRFLATMGVFLNHFKVGRYKHPAPLYREKMQKALSSFNALVFSQDLCA
jgi:putative transposase